MLSFVSISSDLTKDQHVYVHSFKCMILMLRRLMVLEPMAVAELGIMQFLNGNGFLLLSHDPWKCVSPGVGKSHISICQHPFSPLILTGHESVVVSCGKIIFDSLVCVYFLDLTLQLSCKQRTNLVGFYLAKLGWRGDLNAFLLVCVFHSSPCLSLHRPLSCVKSSQTTGLS